MRPVEMPRPDLNGLICTSRWQCQRSRWKRRAPFDLRNASLRTAGAEAIHKCSSVLTEEPVCLSTHLVVPGALYPILRKRGYGPCPCCSKRYLGENVPGVSFEAGERPNCLVEGKVQTHRSEDGSSPQSDLRPSDDACANELTRRAWET